MRHLKTFIGVNESTSGNCDFETFKEIMYEVTDDFTNIEFNDYTDEDSFYDCWINLSSDFMNYDDLNLSFEYLDDIIEPYDAPDNIDYILDENLVYEKIDSYLDELFKAKSDIDKLIEDNKKISKLFKDIEEYILPRFKSFDNYVQTDIGQDTTGRIRLTFEMKERE